MIGNFEIQRPSLSLNENKINFSDLSAITDVFLFIPSKYFTLVEAAVSSNYVAAIANKELFCIHNIKDVSDDSEQPVFVESKQNFRYLTQNGKKRFKLMVNVDIDYYILLKKFEGQNLKAIFGDVNKNLIGINDGVNFKPFKVASIMVEPIGFGIPGQTSWVKINIDLADPSELNQGYSFKPDFDFSILSNEEVAIDSITSIDLYTVQFDVADSCGNAIDDLIATDFTLIDEIGGTLTLDSFTNLGSGSYEYVSNEVQYLGTINLVSTKYNAIADYSFSTPQYNPAQYNNSQYTTS